VTVVAAVPSALTLRCHRCSHAVGTSALAVRIVALFKPSLAGRLAPGHTAERRERCASCGWVNVFHPETRREPIEVK
jgi:hypothetical protein